MLWRCGVIVTCIALLTLLVPGCEEQGTEGQETGNRQPVVTGPYVESFDSVVITTSWASSSWFRPSGCTGIVQVVDDPTGAGKGKVLELRDTVRDLGDMGAVVYSPAIEYLRDITITGKTLELDFYPIYSPTFTPRWFLLAKTHSQAFVMVNGINLEAYASLSHNRIRIDTLANRWLRLKIEFQQGTYNVFVYDGATLVGEIRDKANNPESYDQFFLGSAAAGDGRLFFGSWFSYTGCPDRSYGHVYIDNIRVY